MEKLKIAMMSMTHGHTRKYYQVLRENPKLDCSFAQAWAPSCPRRVIGTHSETAFDVFSIKGSTAYITRFGAGADRCGILLRRIDKTLKYHI